MATMVQIVGQLVGGGINLYRGLASNERQVQADMRTHLIHHPARDVIPPLSGTQGGQHARQNSDVFASDDAAGSPEMLSARDAVPAGDHSS